VNHFSNIVSCPIRSPGSSINGVLKPVHSKLRVTFTLRPPLKPLSVIGPLRGETVEGKVIPVLNYAPRHEDVLEEWMYSSTYSLTSALDGGGGQLHVPAALPPRKEPPLPIGEEGG
jgi:hypothetical protein